MVTIVGSDIPTGDEVKWYVGDTASATTLIKEDLVVAETLITLSQTAEFGSVVVVTAAGAMTNEMLELDTAGTGAADETLGTFKVDVGTDTGTVTAYYLALAPALVQVMACKDVSTNLSIDTKETEVHGQTQKLQKTGAATRTASLEEVDYNDTLVGAIFGDLIDASPVAGDKKWTDNFTATKKISALVGKQYQSGVLIKKWYLMGCQVSKIDSSFPTADYYSKSMDFLVDYMVSTTLVPN